jgi:hypothetical protein
MSGDKVEVRGPVRVRDNVEAGEDAEKRLWLVTRVPGAKARFFVMICRRAKAQRQRQGFFRTL